MQWNRFIANTPADFDIPCSFKTLNLVQLLPSFLWQYMKPRAASFDAHDAHFAV